MFEARIKQASTFRKVRSKAFRKYPRILLTILWSHYFQILCLQYYQTWKSLDHHVIVSHMNL